MTSEKCMPLERANTPKMAILFLGNIGAGKSALLSQIGGRFASGVKFREGLTRNICEYPVELGTNPPTAAVLMDVPGLFEPNRHQTEVNCVLLTKALRRDYRFKVVFVLKAENRGPSDQDLVLMSVVNKCVRDADSLNKVEFQVIVNQIQDDDVYRMYEKEVARDNFASFFAKLQIENFSFDINIRKVILLMHDKAKLEKKGFAADILKMITGHIAIKVSLVNDIHVTNEELTLFESARAHTATFFAGAVAGMSIIASIIALFN
ncbi:hypothetical protein BGZ73_008179 [Actinomortierella ambigua]|nr:hypothetical protein BGZ73_008179 [Actinomortierella ambigua]